MSVNGPSQNVGGGGTQGYSIGSLQSSNLKKKDPLIQFFKNFDVNSDGTVSKEEALMLLAKYQTDGNADFSRGEFGRLKSDYGNMGRGEKHVLNNDFLTDVFGTDDVQITTDGNKKTFRTTDGTFLGTVEQDGDKYTFFNEQGIKTKDISMSGANITTSLYDDAGEYYTETTTVYQGAGTETTKYYSNGAGIESITYEGDNLIAQHGGVVKEEFYNEDETCFKKTTNSDGIETTYSLVNDEWQPYTAPVQEEVTDPVVEQESYAVPTFKEALGTANNTVTIDETGSHQRLNRDNQWQTSVRIPQRFVNDEIPQEIQIGLPSSYGANAYQTLKLVDGTTNVYTDRAGNRKFQVNIAEDGSISLKHIEIDDDKVRTFLDDVEPSAYSEELEGIVVTQDRSTGEDRTVRESVARAEASRDIVPFTDASQPTYVNPHTDPLTYLNQNSAAQGFINSEGNYWLKIDGREIQTDIPIASTTNANTITYASGNKIINNNNGTVSITINGQTHNFPANVFRLIKNNGLPDESIISLYNSTPQVYATGSQPSQRNTSFSFTELPFAGGLTPLSPLKITTNQLGLLCIEHNGTQYRLEHVMAGLVKLE